LSSWNVPLAWPNHAGRQRLTPAMQAGITRELWTMLYDEVMA
jgi:hypothetical protein